MAGVLFRVKVCLYFGNDICKRSISLVDQLTLFYSFQPNKILAKNYVNGLCFSDCERDDSPKIEQDRTKCGMAEEISKRTFEFDNAPDLSRNSRRKTILDEHPLKCF